MARFRAPSVSSVSSTNSRSSLVTVTSGNHPKKRTGTLPTALGGQMSVASTSTVGPVQKKDKGKARARTRAEMDPVGQREQVRMAMKKAEVKTIAKPSSVQWSFVANRQLCSSVTEEQLETLFKACGSIKRLQIRASGGVSVPTANMEATFFGLCAPPTGVHYATVEYTTPAAARLALDLDGAVLNGRKILVSFSASQLPELSEVLQGRITRKKDPYPEKRAVWRAKLNQLKRLTYQRTEHVVAGGGESSGARAAKVVRGVAERLGLYETDAAGGTAAGAHQDGRLREPGSSRGGATARHAAPLAKQITFPKTLA
ncbi:hypothetical protein C8Q78DRAFT_1000188 [Trametes maxima]|nr:hypothetical protein C8Q78DRAFT_1000188 [Trametes maxima]